MTEVGFYPGRRIAKRGNHYFAYLNLWPLAGIMMALLFITILANEFQRPRHGVSVDLAAVGRPAMIPWANREDAIRVGVTRDGILFFRDRRTLIADLPEQIQESVRSGAEKRIYLLVDGRAKYGEVKVVLDRVRDSGIQDVSFLVEKKRGN